MSLFKLFDISLCWSSRRAGHLTAEAFQNSFMNDNCFLLNVILNRLWTATLKEWKLKIKLNYATGRLKVAKKLDYTCLNLADRIETLRITFPSQMTLRNFVSLNLQGSKSSHARNKTQPTQQPCH